MSSILAFIEGGIQKVLEPLTNEVQRLHAQLTQLSTTIMTNINELKQNNQLLLDTIEAERGEVAAKIGVLVSAVQGLQTQVTELQQTVVLNQELQTALDEQNLLVTDAINKVKDIFTEEVEVVEEPVVE